MAKKEDCCLKCGEKRVDILNPSYPDKRVTLRLLRCSNCKEIQFMILAFSGDFPFNEAVKIRDKTIKKYHLDISA